MISKATPYPNAPPYGVAPYRFPTLSKTRLPAGVDPSVHVGKTGQKEYRESRAHGVPGTYESLKTVPWPLLPPALVVP